MKLTPTFPGHIKPVHVGVYQRHYRLGGWRYCYWNGKNWGFPGDSAEDSTTFFFSLISRWQNLPWRGVMKDNT